MINTLIGIISGIISGTGLGRRYCTHFSFNIFGKFRTTRSTSN